MDAELKAAFDSLNARMDVLTGKIDALGITLPGGTVPPLPPPSSRPVMGKSADGAWELHVDMQDPQHPFLHDFYFAEHPGAQKGVYLNLWAAAKMMMSMMGGLYSTPELYVVTLLNPQPDGGRWLDTIQSVADLGWVDASAYRVQPGEVGGAAAARWTAAGRPSVDAEGYLVVGGTYHFNQKGEKMKKGDNSEFVVTKP